MRPLAALAVVFLIAACSSGGESDAPLASPVSTTTNSPATTESVVSVQPEGFDLQAATITSADGLETPACLWVAASSEQRAQGLMFVDDLGAGDGMAFVYEAPTTGSFWMKNTLLPLTIAFYGPDGGYLDAFDMEPCTTDICQSYPTAEGFTIAIEFARSTAESFGAVPGSQLALSGDACR